MDINELVNLSSKVWTLPILAAFQDGVPGRQAPLLAHTGAGRTAFAASMGHLIESGYAERNPGHGHPLRPEFRLTEKGHAAAELAAALLEGRGGDDTALFRKSWTLPVLSTLRTPRRFAEIRVDISPVTDRALSQSLKALSERRWIARDVDAASHPPRPVYSAIGVGTEIGEVLWSAVHISSHSGRSVSR